MPRMKFNRVAAYKTTDGKILTDRAEYVAHERQLAFGAKIDALVAEKLPTCFTSVEEYNSGDDEPVGKYAVNADGMRKFVLDNADALRNILTGKSTVKRTRTKKAAVKTAEQPVAAAA